MDICTGTGCLDGTCACTKNKPICASNNICTSVCGPDDICGTTSTCECGINKVCNSSKCEMRLCDGTENCETDGIENCKCSGTKSCDTVSKQCIENDNGTTTFKSKITNETKVLLNKYVLNMKNNFYLLYNNNSIYKSLYTHIPSESKVYTYQLTIDKSKSNGIESPSKFTSTVTYINNPLLTVGNTTISLTQMNILKGNRFFINSTYPYPSNATPVESKWNNSKSSYTDLFNVPISVQSTNGNYYQLELDVHVDSDDYTAYDTSTNLYNDNFNFTGSQLGILSGSREVILLVFDTDSSTNYKYLGTGNTRENDINVLFELTTIRSKAARFKIKS